MQEFKIAILILNYNGLRYLRQLFQSAAFLSKEKDVDVVLVDNASWDDSIPYVSGNFPWIEVIRNDKNYGWGEGYNQAIRLLQQQGKNYTHYLFLNNDVIVTQEWWSEFKSGIFNSPKSVAEWGCRAVFASPFACETLFRVSEGSPKPRALTCQHYSHETADYEKNSVDFHIRLQPKEKSSCSNVGDEYEYKIRVFEPSGAPFSLEFNNSFEIREIESTQKRKTVTVTLKAGHDASENKISIEQGQTLIIHRFLYASKNELHTLIQNSGSGLNHRFEGYDLHCYQPLSTPQSVSEIKAICGVCKAVRSDVFHSLNGFDPAFFMYYEDTDFSIRLKRHGFEFRLIDKAILHHIHAGSSGAQSPFFARQVAWSLLYFHLKHAQLLQRMKTFLKFVVFAFLEKFENAYQPAMVHRTALLNLRKRVLHGKGRGT